MNLCLMIEEVQSLGIQGSRFRAAAYLRNYAAGLSAECNVGVPSKHGEVHEEPAQAPQCYRLHFLKKSTRSATQSSDAQPTPWSSETPRPSSSLAFEALNLGRPSTPQTNLTLRTPLDHGIVCQDHFYFDVEQASLPESPGDFLTRGPSPKCQKHANKHTPTLPGNTMPPFNLRTGIGLPGTFYPPDIGIPK